MFEFWKSIWTMRICINVWLLLQWLSDMP